MRLKELFVNPEWELSMNICFLSVHRSPPYRWRQDAPKPALMTPVPWWAWPGPRVLGEGIGTPGHQGCGRRLPRAAHMENSPASSYVRNVETSTHTKDLLIMTTYLPKARFPVMSCLRALFTLMVQRLPASPSETLGLLGCLAALWAFVAINKLQDTPPCSETACLLSFLGEAVPDMLIPVKLLFMSYS